MVNGSSDRSEVVFDDERVVVNAGIVLAVTLGRRLGIEALVDATVDLAKRPGASRPGRRVLSLIHAMLLGADCIDDCDVLRAGRTEAVLGHRAMAPSTLGTFLRSFTFDAARQALILRPQPGRFSPRAPGAVNGSHGSCTHRSTDPLPRSPRLQENLPDGIEHSFGLARTLRGR